jgi:hypothetical protein
VEMCTTPNREAYLSGIASSIDPSCLWTTSWLGAFAFAIVLPSDTAAALV